MRGQPMRTTLLFCLFVATALPAASQSSPGSSGDPLNAPFPSGGELRVELCSSGAVIRGSDDGRVRVRYGGPEDSANVKTKFKVEGTRGKLEIGNCPRHNFEVTIDVPKETHLHVRMFAGQLDVEQVIGNKDLELHAGQLDVDVVHPEDYAYVDGSVNAGEVDAPSFNVSKGGLFRSFHQEGPGKYRLHAHVGAGQIDLN